MIHHVTGQLTEVGSEHVVLDREGLGFMVAVPKYALESLGPRRGRTVTLHTLMFIEGNQTGGHLEPVIVGFLDAQERLFFRRFTSVKGIGWRKALKALTEPIGFVAAWIDDGDVTALKRLPGIGPRTAELIVAELRGKMKDLARTDGSRADVPRLDGAQRDALEILVSLGDARGDAEQWLARAAQLHRDVTTADEWIRAAYRVKTGVEA